MCAKPRQLRMLPVSTIRVLFIVVISAIWLLVDTHQAHACVCERSSPAEARNSAGSIFAGRVIDARTYYHPSASFPFEETGGFYEFETVFTLKVNTVWRGRPYEITYIRSVHDQTSCGGGKGLIIGKEYLIYARSNMVSTCDRAPSLASAQEDLAELGDGQPPESGTVAPRPVSMDNWCSDLEVRLAKSNYIRLRSGFMQCESDSASASSAAPTLEPTPTAVTTPIVLAAAVTSAPTPVPSPKPAEVSQEATAPGWLIPTVAGVVGVLVGALATTLTLRRRGGGA